MWLKGQGGFMRADKKIFIAFCLNLIFSIFEFFGGIITGSIAIISDAIHDFGDCLGIGSSFVFEKISTKEPNDKYTFGYYRYSILGSIIQSVILISGSVMVGYNAVLRMIDPIPINYNGMIIFGIVGVIVNFIAAYFTSGGKSLNQKAINLHMIEDVLGWVIVLLGAIVMRFTDWTFLDAVLSLALAAFIAINAIKNLNSVLDIFLEKTPSNVNISDLKQRLLSIEGVAGLHHLHVWSMDGYRHGATMHVVTDADFSVVKKKIKEELAKYDISHSTIECEKVNEVCEDKHCQHLANEHSCRHHHHHHHH